MWSVTTRTADALIDTTMTTIATIHDTTTRLPLMRTALVEPNVLH